MEAKRLYNPLHEKHPSQVIGFENYPHQKGSYMITRGHTGVVARWKGTPETSRVHAMDFVKDMFSTPLMLVRKKTLMAVFFIGGLSYLVFRKFAKKIFGWVIWIFLESVWNPLQKYKLNPMKYTPAVREIYRLFSVLIDREQQESIKEKWRKLRDIVCLVLEYDNSYRFRLQDIIAEMNMEEMKFDEEDLYFIEKRDPREYRYESYVDYTEYDRLLEKAAQEKFPPKLRQIFKETINSWLDWRTFGEEMEKKYSITVEDLKEAGYSNWKEFYDKVREIPIYSKVELLKFQFEEKVMSLKERYQAELDRMNAEFQEEKDALIQDMSNLINRFWERTNKRRVSYQETEKLLNEEISIIEEKKKELESKEKEQKLKEAK